MSREIDGIVLEDAIELLKGMDAVGRIRWAYEHFGSGVVLTTSGGRTSRILPHLAQRAVQDKKIPTIFVDTGHYVERTYEHVSLMMRDGVDIRLYSANMSPRMMETFYGRLWEREGNDFEQFLTIVKHEPLNRAFRELGARLWLRGLMGFQSRERANMPVLEYKNGLFRLYPAIDWTKEQANKYLEEHNLPVNQDHFDITKGASGKKECKIGDMCGFEHGDGV